MVKIEAIELGKKFKNEWIFKNLNAVFEFNQPTAIIGPNGSGKSTLMQVLANVIPQNVGKINYSHFDKAIKEEEIFKKIAYSAPYTELIEEFTLKETIAFHVRFKAFINNISESDFINMLDFQKHADKQIKFFSSGMKQKLKLGLAFYDNSEMLFLDEPSSNLDKKTTDWYLEEVQKAASIKSVIISSNEPKEYIFCKNHINILNYKS